MKTSWRNALPNCLQWWCHAFDALIMQGYQGLFHFSVVYSVHTALSCLVSLKEKWLWTRSAPQTVCKFVSNTCAHLAMPLKVGLGMKELFSTRTSGAISLVSVFFCLFICLVASWGDTKVCPLTVLHHAWSFYCSAGSILLVSHARESENEPLDPFQKGGELLQFALVGAWQQVCCWHRVLCGEWLAFRPSADRKVCVCVRLIVAVMRGVFHSSCHDAARTCVVIIWSTIFVINIYWQNRSVECTHCAKFTKCSSCF